MGREMGCEKDHPRFIVALSNGGVSDVARHSSPKSSALGAKSDKKAAGKSEKSQGSAALRLSPGNRVASHAERPRFSQVINLPWVSVSFASASPNSQLGSCPPPRASPRLRCALNVRTTQTLTHILKRCIRMTQNPEIPPRNLEPTLSLGFLSSPIRPTDKSNR